MSIRLKLLAIRRKLTELRQRSHWPELSRYCGCCQLSTGIYIQCIISLISIVVLGVYNGFFLCRLLETRGSLREVDASHISEKINMTISDDDMEFIGNVLKAVAVYYLVWISLKIIYVAAILFALYSLYSTRPKLLRAAYCVMIPNWVFDIIMFLGAKTFVNPIIQIVFLIDICLEGYNLLAMLSVYKQMRKKSRIVPAEDFTATRLDNVVSTPSSINPSVTESTLFCTSCASLHSRQQNRSERVNCPVIETPSEASSFDVAIPSSDDKEKTVNFKDGPIIFNQELLGQSSSLFVERNETPIVRVPRPKRPTSLNV